MFAHQKRMQPRQSFVHESAHKKAHIILMYLHSWQRQAQSQKLTLNVPILNALDSRYYLEDTVLCLQY